MYLYVYEYIFQYVCIIIYMYSIIHIKTLACFHKTRSSRTRTSCSSFIFALNADKF